MGGEGGGGGALQPLFGRTSETLYMVIGNPRLAPPGDPRTASRPFPPSPTRRHSVPFSPLSY